MNNSNNSNKNKITHFINKHEKDVLKEAFPNATYKQVEEIIKLNINPFLLSYYTAENLSNIYKQESNFIPNKIYFRIGRVWIKNEEGTYENEENHGEIVYLCPSGEFSYNGIIKCKLIIPGKEKVNNIYKNKISKSGNSSTKSGNSNTESGNNITENESNITLFKNYKFEKNPDCYYYHEVSKVDVLDVLAFNHKLSTENASTILKRPETNINELLELLFAIDYNNQFIINK